MIWHIGSLYQLIIHQQPNAVWSPLYLSLIENLVNRNGILNFFHDHLRQAVENKYLQTADDKMAAYRKLAQFFESRPIDDRKVGLNRQWKKQCVILKF